MKKIDKNWTIYLIPHFHYDPAWVATPDYYAQISCENIKYLLDTLDKYPDYCFILDQVVLIKEFKKRYPKYWSKLKEKIKEDKIELVCGMYTMPDLFIPSGESLIRQFLYGKRYFLKNFGKEVDVGWIIDPWGQPHQLPQILRKAGFDYYVFWRGMQYDAPSEFKWRSPDDTEILTHWMPKGYGTEDRYSFHPLEEAFDLLNSLFNDLKVRATTSNILLTEGGDFTPPDPSLLNVIEEFNKKHKQVQIQISTPKPFFKEIEKHKEELETISGEFLAGRYTQLTPGTWDSRIWVKMDIRECEFLALKAERLATIAWILGKQYPSQLITETWETFLYNHFHDIACGCCIDEVYDKVKKDFEQTKKSFKQIINTSIGYILDKIDTGDKGEPVVVFNLHSWNVTGPTETEISFKEPGISAITLQDAKNREIAIQIIEEEKYANGNFKRVTIAFIAENVPAMGYKLYRAVSAKEAINETSIIATKKNLENTYFKIELDDETGAIIGLYDKINKKEVFMGFGNEVYVESDVGDVFYHQYSVQLPKEPLLAEYTKNREESISRKIRLVEAGPIRAKLVTQNDYYAITHPTAEGGIKVSPISNFISWTKKVILYDQIPRIDFVTTIENKHRHIRIRAKFPVRIWNDTFTCETICGTIERPINQPKDLPYRTKLYDFDPIIEHVRPDAPWLEKPFGTYPVQNWMDFGTKDYGVSLINLGLPAHEVRDNTIYLTLLRSVDMETLGYGGPYIPTPNALEHGKYEFKYSIYPHKGDWKTSKPYKVAYEHNCPLIAITTFQHKGDLSNELSFITVHPDNLLVKTVKKAEDEDAVIIRCVEMEGKNTKGQVSFFKDIKEAFSTDLLERNQLKEKSNKNLVETEIKACEIKTLKLVP